MEAKGTGRARAGSSRIPHWRGRNSIRPKATRLLTTNAKKNEKTGSRCSFRPCQSNSVYVVDAWDFETPSTKQQRRHLKL